MTEDIDKSQLSDVAFCQKFAKLLWTLFRKRTRVGRRGLRSYICSIRRRRLYIRSVTVIWVMVVVQWLLCYLARNQDSRQDVGLLE